MYTYLQTYTAINIYEGNFHFYAFSLCLCALVWDACACNHVSWGHRRMSVIKLTHDSLLNLCLHWQPAIPNYLPFSTHPASQLLLIRANVTPSHLLSECCGLKARSWGLSTKHSHLLSSLYRPLQALRNMFAHCSSFFPLCCPRWHHEHPFPF